MSFLQSVASTQEERPSKPSLDTASNETLVEACKKFLKLEKDAELKKEDVYQIVKSGATRSGFDFLDEEQLQDMCSTLYFYEKNVPFKEISHIDKPEEMTLDTDLNEPLIPKGKEKPIGCCFSCHKKCDNSTFRYLFWAIVIIILTLVPFTIFSFVTFFDPKLMALLGPACIVTRGCALALCFITGLTLLLMCKRFITLLRSFLGRFAVTLFDKYIYLHRVAGRLVMIFSLIHTIGHLSGTFPSFVQEKNVDFINSVLHGLRITKPLSYGDLLATVPSITGFFMLGILFIIWITSWLFVRKRSYELFWWSHQLFIVYIILLYAHGAQNFFGLGFPMATPFVSIPLLIYLIEKLIHFYCFFMWRQKILGSKTSKDGKRVMIDIEKPSGFRYLPGQYLLLFVPEVSYFQWHPFSICTTPESKYVRLIIEEAGGWTKSLLKLMKECEDGKRKYPFVHLDGCFGAPSDLAIHSKRSIMIGVGITPFLSFLYNKAEQLENPKLKDNFSICEYNHFYWVTREPSDIVWFAKQIYLLSKFNSEQQKQKTKVYIHLFFTTSKQNENIDSFLFWKCLLNLQERGVDANDKYNLPIHVSLKRPDFEEELAKIRKIHDNGDAINVFTCCKKNIFYPIRKACYRQSINGTRFISHNEKFT